MDDIDDPVVPRNNLDDDDITSVEIVTNVNDFPDNMEDIQEMSVIPRKTLVDQSENNDGINSGDNDRIVSIRIVPPNHLPPAGFFSKATSHGNQTPSITFPTKDLVPYVEPKVTTNTSSRPAISEEERLNMYATIRALSYGRDWFEVGQSEDELAEFGSDVQKLMFFTKRLFDKLPR
ncbi:unnamed protein product [Ambrosiozyma monospora]|uniref:Unnamed protein product n=1 Tax=Ambrosiozyma monospora TaxID=43982 RepID=A0A9W6Z003_AMBMO|nr:unnamed protein product [Ambrosiozyma monospora]